ncbi:MAG TPA: bifunctional YncE family protein/alkaline phosphatase family protein [Acidimicrobiales bacterium]
MTKRLVAIVLCVAGLLIGPAAFAVIPSIVGPSTGMMPNGRVLEPDGRTTAVGDFPTGGALTPDGRYFWAVDSGYGHDDVNVVSLTTGNVVQVLPLPGASGGIAFSADGTRAYVSGEPQGVIPAAGPTKANQGDAIHVFSVDPSSGHATEQSPIQLPATSGGTGQMESANPVSFIYQPPGPGPSSGLGWPIGLAVTPDSKTLVVALNQADQVAIVDLASGTSKLIKVGRYPFGVATDGTTAYVSNEYDGTVSVINLASAAVTSTVAGLGGPIGDQNAHPQGMTLDAAAHRLYVAVTNRDLVAEIDTQTLSVAGAISVGRVGGIGTAPVALAKSPDGSRLYSADAGEDAVAVLRLSDGKLIGRIPTAAYPTAVAVTPDERHLVWLAAQGLGAGPNPQYGQNFAASQNAPYGQYDMEMLLGRVGVLDTPSDADAAHLGQIVDKEVRPADYTPAPLDTPLESPGGGPSAQIKHVFYIVKENRTYDQIFGSDSRGNGDPRLELFDDNGVAGPAGGVTPNAHALTRMFPLMDNFYADSQVSVDGHIITTGGYVTDFVQRALHANYSGRGRAVNFGQDPVTLPPQAFIFDQAVRQGVSFQNFGEFNAGDTPQGNDGRPTYAQSQAGFVGGYPLFFGCDNAGLVPVTPTDHNIACDSDSGTLGPAGNADVSNSRFDFFQADFNRQVAAGTVPSFTYLTLPNDHTNGVQANYPTPASLVADNDLGLGQIVDLISHSPIWSSSAIFVVEDDSQDGADHVDAHRMPAYVISPWTKHGVVVHTRYDQYSALRSAEMILGLRPLSLNDGLAEPMYDCFVPSDQAPDLTAYSAVAPRTSLDATTLVSPPGMDGVLPYNVVDLVPQHLFDDALYHSIYGSQFTPPAAGPNASEIEANRTSEALKVFRDGGNVTQFLLKHPVGNQDG